LLLKIGELMRLGNIALALDSPPHVEGILARMPDQPPQCGNSKLGHLTRPIFPKDGVH
jgi:hypothetical protein